MCCWSAAAPAVRLRSVGWPAAVRQGSLSTPVHASGSGQVAVAVASGDFHSRVRAITAGYDNSFAVLSDGSVVGWGGRLGMAVPDQTVPIAGLASGIVAVSSGRYHFIALAEDGCATLEFQAH